MQILANALPGFRDLRAPLTAGYLWLLFAWLWAAPGTTHYTARAGPLRVLSDLAHVAGRIWIAVAVGTLAYLVGSVSVVLSESIRGAASRASLASDFLGVRLIRDPERIYMPPPPIYSREENYLEDTGIGAMDNQVQEALARMTGASPFANQEFQASLRLARDDAYVGVVLEAELPATLLVGDKPDLFAEVDRLRSEGEFRLAVAPPLLGLTLLLTASLSAWYVLAMVGVLALVVLGLRRVNESRTLIIQAVGQGRIESAALKRFQRDIDRLLELPR